MRHLIVNGDDFGHSRGVTDGILEAHTDGILTSTSLMVFRPAAVYAAGLAADHPRLSVGLHFVEDGSADLDDPAELERSLREQLARFRELIGREPTHIDSHHHVHTEEERPSTVARVAAELGVPVRGDGQVGYVGGFYGQWEWGVTDLTHIERPYLLELVETEVPEGWTEIACHPARLTGDLQSAYLQERAVELATLTTSGLAAEIAERGVTLASYHDWAAARGG